MNESFEVYKSPIWSGYYLKDSNLKVQGSCILRMGKMESMYITIFSQPQQGQLNYLGLVLLS